MKIYSLSADWQFADAALNNFRAIDVPGDVNHALFKYGDLPDPHIGVLEHGLGVGKTDAIAVHHRALPRPFPKATVKIGVADTAQRGVFFDPFVAVPLVA